jgi:transposase
MRGSGERSGSLFSYVDLEARVRSDHPLRVIREIANAALSDLSKAFTALYADFGRPSIAPEKLLRAMLLQAFYGRPLGAPTDRAVGVRSVVPLVCGSRRG